MSTAETIRLHCKALRLPTISALFEQSQHQAQQEGWTMDTWLLNLLEQELADRQQRRIQRLTKQAQLPVGKTLATFDQDHLPLRLRQQMAQLQHGDLLSRADNLLLFGLPGTGKTHLAAALGYEWTQLGFSVLFTPTYKLVGRLLKAKRDFELERELRRLDRFEALILDDIGYVQQSRQEMEVLFTLLAERYERRSVIITSNLVFSQWDQIFKDPLTTAAAIDRVVHHATIIEFGPDIPSRRIQDAALHNARIPDLPNSSSDNDNPTLEVNNG